MLGRDRRRRRRARKEAERILKEARAAAMAAQRTIRTSRSSLGDPAQNEEEMAEAIQSAILNSISPYLTKTTPERDDRHGRSTVVLFLVGLGVGAGVAAWARREEEGDGPLAEDEEWELVHGPSTRMIKSVINETLDKSDVVLRRLAKVTSETMGAAVGTVADAAGPTAELVTNKLRVARERATSEVIRTLDDLDAVWDDDSSTPASPDKRPVAKKPTPRKPVEGKPVSSKSAQKPRKPVRPKGLSTP